MSPNTAALYNLTTTLVDQESKSTSQEKGFTIDKSCQEYFIKNLY